MDNYVERVDNFVDMSEKGWDKTRKIAKKQEVVINMRAWKQGVQEKAVEKVIHILYFKFLLTQDYDTMTRNVHIFHAFFLYLVIISYF